MKFFGIIIQYSQRFIERLKMFIVNNICLKTSFSHLLRVSRPFDDYLPVHHDLQNKLPSLTVLH